MAPNDSPKPAVFTRESAFAEQPTEPKAAAFSFEKVRKFTGYLQYRVNDMARCTNVFGDWRRGEVKKVSNQKEAENLVQNGDFAHVAEGTPIGQPEEFRLMDSPKKKAAEPAPAEASTPTTSTTGTATDTTGTGEGTDLVPPADLEGKSPAPEEPIEET